MTLLVELTSAAFGVLGTVLLALNGPRAGWGFVAYLVSNAGWILFAWIHAHWGLLAQQLAFTASSLLGAYVWLIRANLGKWAVSLAFELNGLADWVWELDPSSRALLRLGGAIDKLAIPIYYFGKRRQGLTGNEEPLS